MKKLICMLIGIIGIVLALYCGGWLLFIKPIIECCMAFDQNMLTGGLIGITVLKCICANIVASIIIRLSLVVVGMISIW